MILMICICLIVPMILMIINNFINKKIMTNLREKISPFECGFNPKTSARLPFSIRFYMIAIIFLIFDIEITLIMPLPFIKNLMNISMWLLLASMFLLILLFGLFHEWKQGALDWSK